MPQSRADTAPDAEVEIRTTDGVALRAHTWTPAAFAKSRGALVLSHAMFAHKSEFARAGFAAHFAHRGFDVCAFDFRDHGDSVGGGPDAPPARSPASYDDLVRSDLPEVVRAVRLRTDGPLIVVGHSLGGHVAAAASGLGLLDADGLVLVGANMWLRRFEPSVARWRAKVAVAHATLAITRAAGRMPARRLRIGSDDAGARLIAAVFRPVTHGAWRSDDGRVDYAEALARVTVPVLAVVSDGDALMCHPHCGARFARTTAGTHEVFRIARADDGGPAPDHMGMLTTRGSSSAWLAIERFLDDVARPFGR
jgi:alpha-beta hydrolase superfamily lysophospholipase